MPDLQVVIKKIETQKVAALRRTVPTYADVAKLAEQLFGYLAYQKAKLVGPLIVIYHDPDFKENNVDMELAQPIEGGMKTVDPFKVRELEGIDQAACFVHRGLYEKLHASYLFMDKWLDTNGFKVSGPNREVHLQGPDQTNDPANYITEVQLPVVKK